MPRSLSPLSLADTSSVWSGNPLLSLGLHLLLLLGTGHSSPTPPLTYSVAVLAALVTWPTPLPPPGTSSVPFWVTSACSLGPPLFLYLGPVAFHSGACLHTSSACPSACHLPPPRTRDILVQSASTHTLSGVLFQDDSVWPPPHSPPLFLHLRPTDFWSGKLPLIHSAVFWSGSPPFTLSACPSSSAWDQRHSGLEHLHSYTQGVWSVTTPLSPSAAPLPLPGPEAFWSRTPPFTQSAVFQSRICKPTPLPLPGTSGILVRDASTHTFSSISVRGTSDYSLCPILFLHLRPVAFQSGVLPLTPSDCPLPPSGTSGILVQGISACSLNPPLFLRLGPEVFRSGMSSITQSVMFQSRAPLLAL